MTRALRAVNRFTARRSYRRSRDIRARARVITTLVNGLHHHNKRLGIAAVCIGGGEALAIAVERVE